MLRSAAKLSELYIRYNGIRGMTGKGIFHALVVNSNLKVLDIAHNGLGGTIAVDMLS